MDKIIEKLFYITGIVCTFSALRFQVGMKERPIVMYLIPLLLVLQFLKSKKIYRPKMYKLNLILIVIIFFISSIGSVYMLPKEWSTVSISTAITYSILFGSIIFIFNNEELLKYRKYFFKGLKISCYIQLIWEFLQTILWYSATISLNQLVFEDLLKVKVQGALWTNYDGVRFRPSGLSWEPANLSMALVIGFFLTKDIKGKFLFLIGIFISTSRTGMLTWIICYLIYLINMNRKKIKINLYIQKKSIFIGIIFTLILLIGLSIFYHNIYKSFNLAINSLYNTLERMTSEGRSVDASVDIHSGYYSNAFYILSQSKLFQILFGYGTNIAGYAYSTNLGLYTDLIGWTPETDIISVLIGNGIIGFIVYYLFFINIIRYNKKDIEVCILAVCILVGGIFYVYFMSPWIILVYLLLFVKDESYKLNLKYGS